MTDFIIYCHRKKSIATAIALVCGIPAAYAMARLQFRGTKSFLGFVIMSQMFAPVVLLVGITQPVSYTHLPSSPHASYGFPPLLAAFPIRRARMAQLLPVRRFFFHK